jgi:hypothetical protein
MEKLTKKKGKEKKRLRKQRYLKRKKGDLPKSSIRSNRKKFEMIEIKSDNGDVTSRMQKINQIKKVAKEAGAKFEDKVKQFQKWFTLHDPCYLLSFCVFYFLSFPEGIDPEIEGRNDIPPFIIEILQALALMQERSFNPTPLLNSFEKFKEDLIELEKIIFLKGFNILNKIEIEKEIKTYALSFEMMSDTLAVRNWAYPEQMKKISLDLAKLLRTDFEKLYCLDPEKLIVVFLSLVEEVEYKLNKHVKKIRDLFKINNYIDLVDFYNKHLHKIEKIEGERIEEFWKLAHENIDVLKSMLICHSDLMLMHIFTFTIQDIVDLYGDNLKFNELKDIFNSWSLSFEDLKGVEIEHILLSNPIHEKPFIKIEDEKYFSANISLFPHICFSLFEKLLFKSNNVRTKYSDKIKPKYLEDKVNDLFHENFPNAYIYRNIKWKDPVTKTDFENDILIQLENFVICVECKSGLVTAPARRGAPDRLSKTLKKLIEEPAIQANRLIENLKNNYKFDFNSNENKISINCSTIDYFIPIGITLENLNFLGSNIKKMIEAKIFKKKISELAPSISLSDLECIFELLPLETQKIHYLERRREIEAHLKYEADELDLLAFYLNTGFNIGDLEFDEKAELFLPLASKELDPYFISKKTGKLVEIPEPDLTKYWKELLYYISRTRFKKWVEASYVLLNFTKEEQEKFMYNFEKLKRQVILGKTNKKHNWVILTSGPIKRRFSLIGYPYNIDEKKERNEMLLILINSEEVKNSKGLVCIGVDVRKHKYPYNVLAGRYLNNLFALDTN